MFEQMIAHKEQGEGGETVISLMQLKNDMTLFGISDDEYRAYIADVEGTID